MREEMEFGTGVRFVKAIAEFVGRFTEAAGVEDQTSIQLAVEEYYVNVVEHGFGGKEGGTVAICLSCADGVIQVEIADDGPEFDPTTVSPPDKPSSVEEADIGGLGIVLIRKLMDETEYRREGGRNVFVMRKRF